MRNLVIGGKTFFKETKAISKVIFHSLITTFPKYIVNEVEKIQKAFLWKNSAPKVKHETLRNDYKARGLKNIDMPNNIVALQRSWIRRIYDKFFL